MMKDGSIHRDFKGLVEQGNEILSKVPITKASNEFFYKSYSYTRDWSHWREEDHGRAVQVAELRNDSNTFQVLNLHGIWTHNKLGDERTLKECEYVIKTAKSKKLPTIITGDFNLLPKTESIQLVNKEYRNLITEYSIQTTRPNFKDQTEAGGNVVDYIFVSDEIKVLDFKVVNTDISDHLPLLLNFEIY